MGVPRLGKPSHLSHSSRETLLRCAKSYWLSRIAKAPQQPSLWLAAGSAVHETTEAYDWYQIEKPDGLEWSDETVKDEWSKKFNHQLDKLRKLNPNEWSWRQAKTEPVGRWQELGPKHVQSYIDWRHRAPYTIWNTPVFDTPAIELDVSGVLPGCPVVVQGFVDRVFRDPVLDKLIILDIKTSQRPPKNADQFAVYGALLQVKYGLEVDLGVAFMTRKGTVATPWPLAQYTPEVMGEVYAEAWEQIERGDFKATPGEACRICDVSAACAAVNGPYASTYDPDHKDYVSPPF